MSEVDIYDPDEYVKKAVEQFNAGQYAGPESESEDSDYADNDEKSFAETLQALTEKTKNSEQELDEAHTEPASDPEAPHAEQSTETTLPVESKPTKETEPADEEGEYIDFTQEELLERASELEKSGQHVRISAIPVNVCYYGWLCAFLFAFVGPINVTSSTSTSLETRNQVLPLCPRYSQGDAHDGADRVLSRTPQCHMPIPQEG